jgi:hypothetical protein
MLEESILKSNKKARNFFVCTHDFVVASLIHGRIFLQLVNSMEERRS